TPTAPGPQAPHRRDSRAATVARRAASARARTAGRAPPPWRLPRSETRWDSGRAVPRRAASRRRARGVPTGGASRRGTWRCDRGPRSGPSPVTPAPAPTRAPQPRRRRGGSLSRLPHPHQHALILGARRRRQTIAAESRLILEVEDEPLRRVGPAQHAGPVAIDAVRQIDHLIRFAQGDEHFPALRQPAGPPFVRKPDVRLLHAPKIIVEGLVLRGQRNRIRR